MDKSSFDIDKMRLVLVSGDTYALIPKEIEELNLAGICVDAMMEETFEPSTIVLPKDGFHFFAKVRKEDELKVLQLLFGNEVRRLVRRMGGEWKDKFYKNYEQT